MGVSIGECLGRPALKIQGDSLLFSGGSKVVAPVMINLFPDLAEDKAGRVRLQWRFMYRTEFGGSLGQPTAFMDWYGNNHILDLSEDEPFKNKENCGMYDPDFYQEVVAFLVNNFEIRVGIPDVSEEHTVFRVNLKRKSSGEEVSWEYEFQ